LVELLDKADLVKVPEISEYVEHYWEGGIDVSDVPVLTDDYAPVENLMNPMTGQPHVREEEGGSVLVEPPEVFMLERSTLTLDARSLFIIAIGICIGLSIVMGSRFRR